MFWDELKYDDKGLVCAVFQDWQSGEVLTLAWMNREAIEKTWQEKQVWLYRRSHGRVMMKGEQSGNVQNVKEIFVDCDGDALVVKIEQAGGAACHKGYRSCFYLNVDEDGNANTEEEPVFDPKQVYAK